MNAPVVFLIFNRPDVTARTFEAIRSAQPSKLLIVADGPRASRPGEQDLCARTRAVTEAVDWPCEVLRNYASENMGCGQRVSSGISWAFAQVDAAIILEDDCLPDPSFFAFCDELLERYRDDPRVMMISADNFLGDARFSDTSYYFSRFAHIWGWATWRRAWQHYDFTMRQWPEKRGAWLREHTLSGLGALHWRKMFDAVASRRLDTWDYQWQFAIWSADGLAISPNTNLVENIGFGADATHTNASGDYKPPLARPAPFPLRHPAQIAPCQAADEHEESKRFPTLYGKLRLILGYLLNQAQALLFRH